MFDLAGGRTPGQVGYIGTVSPTSTEPPLAKIGQPLARVTAVSSESASMTLYPVSGFDPPPSLTDPSVPIVADAAIGLPGLTSAEPRLPIQAPQASMISAISASV